jgi:hypothetical protein
VLHTSIRPRKKIAVFRVSSIKKHRHGGGQFFFLLHIFIAGKL